MERYQLKDEIYETSTSPSPPPQGIGSRYWEVRRKQGVPVSFLSVHHASCRKENVAKLVDIYQ